jgi:RNA polymerase sigma factor (sigma-70 family)
MDPADRFTAMFDDLAPRVYAYARRRCDAASAQDVVADTFLIAWRRRDDLPAEPLPWLLVVARNTLANRRRHQVRQDRLVEAAGRLAVLAGPAAAAEQVVVDRDAVLAAIDSLSDREREAVLLVAWDGLRNAGAAQVAGCSTRAFEVRLSRARARIGRALADPAPVDRARTDDGRAITRRTVH